MARMLFWLARALDRSCLRLRAPRVGKALCPRTRLGEAGRLLCAHWWAMVLRRLATRLLGDHSCG